MESTEQLISRIKAYCKKHDMAESTFGLRAVNDGKLVSRLNAGGSITLRTHQAICGVLAHEQKDGAAA